MCVESPSVLELAHLAQHCAVAGGFDLSCSQKSQHHRLRCRTRRQHVIFVHGTRRLEHEAVAEEQTHVLDDKPRIGALLFITAL